MKESSSVITKNVLSGQQWKKQGANHNWITPCFYLEPMSRIELLTC